MFLHLQLHFLIAIILVQSFFKIPVSLEIIFLIIRGVQYLSQAVTAYGSLIAKTVFVKTYLEGLSEKSEEKKGFILLKKVLK